MNLDGLFFAGYLDYWTVGFHSRILPMYLFRKSYVLKQISRKIKQSVIQTPLKVAANHRHIHREADTQKIQSNDQKNVLNNLLWNTFFKPCSNSDKILEIC